MKQKTYAKLLAPIPCIAYCSTNLMLNANTAAMGYGLLIVLVLFGLYTMMVPQSWLVRFSAKRCQEDPFDMAPLLGAAILVITVSPVMFLVCRHLGAPRYTIFSIPIATAVYELVLWLRCRNTLGIREIVFGMVLAGFFLLMELTGGLLLILLLIPLGIFMLYRLFFHLFFRSSKQEET